MELNSHPTHRNSIGYIVGRGGGDAAKIVWGLAADGSRVWIGDTPSGAACGLRCECSVPLVARRGLVRAHHFAHAAGSSAVCHDAARAAAASFIEQALTSRAFRLPVLGKRFGWVRFAAIATQKMDDWICLSADLKAAGEDRTLNLLFKLRRGQSFNRLAEFSQQRQSVVLVDLSKHRNQSDEGLRAAILRLADRRWLYNDRHPNAVAEETQYRDNLAAYMRLQLPKLEPFYGLTPVAYERAPLRPSVQGQANAPPRPSGLSNDEVGRRLFGDQWRP